MSLMESYHITALVNIFNILRNLVNVVHDYAIPVVILGGQDVANIDQSASVEEVAIFKRLKNIWYNNQVLP